MLVWYFRQFVRGTKSCGLVGQKFQFLSCSLPPVCHVHKTVLQIKH